MSGGLLRATPHYVRAPGKDKTGGVSRNTLAIFMQPRYPSLVVAHYMSHETNLVQHKEQRCWTSLAFHMFCDASEPHQPYGMLLVVLCIPDDVSCYTPGG